MIRREEFVREDFIATADCTALVAEIVANAYDRAYLAELQRRHGRQRYWTAYEEAYRQTRTERSMRGLEHSTL